MWKTLQQTTDSSPVGALVGWRLLLAHGLRWCISRRPCAEEPIQTLAQALLSVLGLFSDRQCQVKSLTRRGQQAC